MTAKKKAKKKSAKKKAASRKPKIHPVEKALKDATGLTRDRGESDNAWRARLARATLNDIPEDDWNSLNDAAQTWANDAADALEAKKPVAGFDGKAAKKKSAKKKKKKAASSKPKGKTSRAATGVGGEFRKLLYKKPGVTKEEAIAAAAKRGLDVAPATAQTQCYMVKTVLHELSELGYYDHPGLPETRRTRTASS